MPATQKTLEAMADEVFELYQLAAAARSRRATASDDLTESEFLTLDILAKDEQLTVGNVQKRIGVVPAQMSRIVRSLAEQGGKGYLSCRINAEDRRRIDVSITAAGRRAYENYRTVRLRTMYETLSVLPPADRLQFMESLRQIRAAFEKRLASGQRT